MSGSSQKVTEIKKKKKHQREKTLVSNFNVPRAQKKKTALYKNVHRQHASLSAS